MRQTSRVFISFVAVFSIAVIVSIYIFPLIAGNKAYAFTYNELSTRGVKISSSAGGNTGTQYTTTFNTATASSPIEGIVINFCDNDPIIGDACTYTSGQSAGLGSASLTSISGGGIDTNTSHWTVTPSTAAPTSNDTDQLELSDSSSTTAISSGTTITIVLSNITNPNYSTCGSPDVHPNCTFYIRMLTFSNPSGATGYQPANPVNGGAFLLDAGGAALSTVAQITIESKVQEELSFCVYANPPSDTFTCSTGSAPSVFLGNNNDVLSTTGTFIDKTIQYDIQTNASVGAQVSMQGNTLTTGGSVTIPAMTTTPVPTGSNDIPTVGTSQFGMCDYGLSTADTNLTWPSSGFGGDAAFYDGDSIVSSTHYNCSDVIQSSGTGTPATTPSTNVNFYFGTAISSTYGDTIAVDSAGGVNTGILAFMADVAATQQAGVYTTTLGLIADGTF